MFRETSRRVSSFLVCGVAKEKELRIITREVS